MGYFEGCHTFARRTYPKSRLDWERYRSRLGEIDGLEIVDLPNRLCCKSSPGEIIETALKMNLKQMILPCSGCYASLTVPARGKIQLVTIPELLLSSMEEAARA